MATQRKNYMTERQQATQFRQVNQGQVMEHSKLEIPEIREQV